jgi:hypothetical protein
MVNDHSVYNKHINILYIYTHINYYSLLLFYRYRIYLKNAIQCLHFKWVYLVSINTITDNRTISRMKIIQQHAYILS